MSKNYDVIVVGAGLGGLSTAAYTARSGLKTLIVDRHNIPGGSSTSFVRGRFEFETSLHELCAVGPEENPGRIRKLVNSLGADVDWAVDMDGTYRYIIPSEGIDADMPCGVPAFCQKMEELVPGSGKPMMEVFKLGMQASQALEFLHSPDFDLSEFGEKFPDFFRMAGHSIHEVLDSLGMPLKAQHIISAYWCYLGAPEDQMDFFNYSYMLLGYVVFGAGQPKLRSHEISLALEKVIRDNGGTIWYNTEVEKILVNDNKAYGIVLDGRELYADHIVSNAYPNKVFGTMIDSKEIPKEAVRMVNSRQLGLSFMTVYLGMNKSAEELGITAYSNFIAKTSDSNVQQSDAYNTHEYGGFVIMNCLNTFIPDCTPKGTSQLFFTTFYFGNGWDDVTAEEYFKLKEDTAIRMIEDAEKALGISIMPYIEEIVIAAPPTFARYLNTPEGTPYGYQMNMWDGFVQRKVNRKSERYVNQLYFVGASTEYGDGYSSALESGADVGREIVSAEKQRGGRA